MGISEEVRAAINDMFSCRDLSEHMGCYQFHQNLLKDWTFIVFVEEGGVKLPVELRTNYDNEFAIINLGCGDGCYAINQSIYEQTLVTGKADYGVDMCVELDTQAVSYLKNVFEEYNKAPAYDKIKDMVQYLNLPGVNYSCLLYMIENAAKKDTIDRIECYKNVKSYNLFKAFNQQKVERQEVPVYDRSEEDIQIDTDMLYNDIFSERLQQAYGRFSELQKTIYILLLKAICIEFENPKKSAKNKMSELLDFVNEKLGVIAERELEVCYHYFEHDDRTKKFFKKVQKNNKNLLDCVNGMAWDLVHVRLIESEYTNTVDGEASFAIHVLLTFDNGLKEILQINPIEQLALCGGVFIPKFKNRWIDTLGSIKEKMTSKESRIRRERTLQNRDENALKKEMEEKLFLLCKQ